MIGNFAESIGGVIGEYIGGVYGQYIVLFLIPIMISAPFFWAAEKFLSQLPEPDYRKPLIAITSAQVVTVLLASIVLAGAASGLLLALPTLVVLGGAALWLHARP